MAENCQVLQGGKKKLKKSPSTYRGVKIQNTKVEDLYIENNREKTCVVRKLIKECQLYQQAFLQQNGNKGQ